jgi:hypothetical protein
MRANVLGSRAKNLEISVDLWPHHIRLSDLEPLFTISLAFLAPNLVRAAVEGRLPRGIGIERLRDPNQKIAAPFAW